MQPNRKQTIGRKRKLEDNDDDGPACKRLKTCTASPNAMNIDKIKQELFSKYHTKFPWSFFKFWEFIASITKNGKNPLNALKCLNLRLVGPFEYIVGDLNQLSDEQILIHYRYYFDLPEFETIILELNSTDNIHYGYWRDDPNYNPVGICKSNGNIKVMDKHCKMIHPMASNLFFFIQDLIKNIKKENDEIRFINESLHEFIQKNKIKLTDKDKLLSFKQREKRIVCKTFHGFGLVVPFKNDIGYREVGYNLNELKRIFKRMNNEKMKNKKVNGEEMECILTNICLADDEGDPGMGYELGIDFFYSYSMFTNQAKRLLINAYNLTNRQGFKKILNAHMNVRGKQYGKYNQLLNIKKNKKKNENSNNSNKKNCKKAKKMSDGKQKITKFFAKKTVKKNVVKKNVVKNTLDELSSDSD